MSINWFKLSALALLAIGVDACQRDRKFHNHGIVKRQATARAPLNADETLIITSFDNNSISDWSYYYTHRYHLAGYNNIEAQWTADRWAEAGLDTQLDTYTVYLDYPVSKSVQMTYADGSVFQPMLEEAVLEVDPTTGYPNRVPTFHGYSANGEATAEFVYVDRGQQVDFERLGKIVT